MRNGPIAQILDPTRFRSDPDRAPRTGVPINLGEDVAEDVCDREQKLSSGNAKWTDRTDLGPDEIRDQKHDDEDVYQDVVITKVAKALVLVRELLEERLRHG